MRVLLDECLPRRLGSELPGHDVRTVPEMGWAGKKNGELLKLAAASPFDIFITIDRSLTYQQNLTSLRLAVITLAARNNRFETLLPLIPAIREALSSILPGETRRVGATEI